MRRLLRYYGFEAEMTGEDRLTARNGSLRVEALLVEEEPELGEEALEKLLGKAGKADRHIVASLGRFSDFAHKLAEQRKVQLWDRHKLEEEVGRMVVAELDVREGKAGEGVLEHLLSGEPGPPGGGDALPEENAVVEFSDPEVMIAPRITQERLKPLIRDRLEGAFRFDLQLVPYYCFVYTCEVDGRAGAPERRVGVILVNAITGETREWPRKEGPVKLDDAHVRMEPSLDEAAALKQARERALSLNTRVFHMKQERGPVTVYEKKTLRPGEDALKMTHKGLVFLPVWGVEGSNGALMVDALTGSIIKEELFRAGPEGNDQLKK